MLKRIIILTVLIKISVATLDGVCNQCLASNDVACLNETHFATCYQGLPTSTITKCPKNRICTDDKHICHNSNENYKPACYHKDYCGECNINNGAFTCLDETTYGFCVNGTTLLENSFISCPKDLVCNYNFKEICVAAATNEPSCRASITNTTEIATSSSTQSIISVTTSAATKEVSTTIKQQTEFTTLKPQPRSADAICGEIGNVGYFKSDDPTCRQFVYCYLLSAQYLGWFYYCDGYFNVTTLRCQVAKPTDCIA